jgi:hypothetical protein
MTIETYTHDKEAHEDCIRIEETNNIYSIKNIEYNSIKERDEIWHRYACNGCGMPPDNQTSGSLIAVSYKNMEEAAVKFVVLRGWVIVKDKGCEVLKYTNLTNSKSII